MEKNRKEILEKLQEMEKIFVDVIIAKKVENEKNLSKKFKAGKITTDERHQRRREFAKILEKIEREKLDELNLNIGLFYLYKDERESDAFVYAMKEATGTI